MDTTTDIEQEFPSDFTVLDIETTGLSHIKNEIIEISALKVRGNNVLQTFSMLVKPERKINSFITQLTGISNEMVEPAPAISEVLPLLLEFIGGDIIAGHNIRFDIGFIQTNLERLKLPTLSNRTIDTLQLARKYCPLKSRSLQSLAEHYSISAEGHHRALNDCIITFNIYRNIKNEYLLN